MTRRRAAADSALAFKQRLRPSCSRLEVMRRNLGDHPAGDGRRGAHDGSEYRGVHPTSVPAERIPWQRPWSTALALSLNRGLEATDLIDDAYTTLERQLASPEGDSVSSPPSRTVPAPRR